MKKVVISGYYGFENFGDEISLQVIVNNLKENGIDITVLSSNPELTSTENGVNSFYTFSVFDIIKQLFVSDVLISGGGSLFQDKTSIKSFLYYIFVVLVAKILGKKVVIFSQGFAPLRCKFLEAILSLVLKNVDYVSVRDEESKCYLQSLGVKAQSFADSAWALDKNRVIKRSKVVVQLREWHNFSDEKIEILAKLISQKYKTTKIEILPFQEAKDLGVCEKLYEALKGNVLDVQVLRGLSTKEITDTIASSYSLIAMRYHACLLGLKHGVHILALSYDEKVTNLSKKFNIPYVYTDESVDLYEMELKKSLERFESSSVNTETVKTEEQMAKKSFENLIRVINNKKKIME